MVKRKKIAINFFSDYKQAAGLTIYLLNIIKGLNLIDDAQKPELVIICNPGAPVDEIMNINYPYYEIYLIEYVIDKNILKRAFNKLARTVFKKNVFDTYKLKDKFPGGIQTIYPYFDSKAIRHIPEKIYWKADFQEKHYPDFFPESDLKWSANFMNNITSGPNVLVLSSNDAINDFEKFHPGHKNITRLLKFTSFLPDFNAVNYDELIKKYSIGKRFFFIANQFWPHKNHLIVLKAINKIKQELNCIFLFSGSTSSYRDENYFPMLQQYIRENDLEQYVKMLGFIDREEQVKLMSESIGIIQPSLFEGWSTVIEDAKALNKLVVASNIKVNIEQIRENVLFFESLNADALAEIIL
ncbi:MAG TPA: glycosyltransferase, partial [Mucilaginibacter sp.]